MSLQFNPWPVCLLCDAAFSLMLMFLEIKMSHTHKIKTCIDLFPRNEHTLLCASPNETNKITKRGAKIKKKKKKKQ